jgi:hypothetical protein
VSKLDYKKNSKHKDNKTLILIIFTITIFLILLFNSINVAYATPDLDPDENCHEKGPYEISSETDDTLKVVKGEDFIIDIKGKGPDVIVRFNPVSLDNDKFEVEPSDKDIEDNSKYDEDNDLNKVSVNFTLIAPDKEGTYKILFYVRSPPGNPPGKPYIDFIEFKIIVGSPSGTLMFDNIFLNSILNHSNIYLGTIALVCFSIGTILAEKNYRKYVKTHAILSGIALILSIVNLIFIYDEAITIFLSWFWTENVDYWHFAHFVVGFIGLGACIVGLLAGLSGIYHKKSGYLTLACWGFNFAFGLIYWGIGLGV